MTSFRWAGLAVALLLAGCGEPEPSTEQSVNITIEDANVFVPSPAPEANGTEPSGSVVTLSSDGLGLGASQRVTFGMARAAAVAAIGAVLGDPIEQGDNQDCGAGVLGFANFRDGLSLFFRDGRFAGWDVEGREGPGFATSGGIAIGSTRHALEASSSEVSVEDSSLGIEFMAGGLSGLLDGRAPTARVTNIWAGVTCSAR